MLVNVDQLSRKIYTRYIDKFVNTEEGEDDIYKYETVYTLATFFITGFITITDIVVINAYYRTKNKKYDLIELTEQYVQFVQNDIETQELMLQLYELDRLELDETKVRSFYNHFLSILDPFSSSQHLRTAPGCLLINRNNSSFWDINRIVHVRILELIFTCLGGYDIEPLQFDKHMDNLANQKLKYIYIKLLHKCIPNIFTSLSKEKLQKLLRYCPRNTNEYNLINLLLSAN
jgi:hypothetical protein